ncbi:MAG: ATPase, partial [Bacteroidales bacterium]|nr:ATPase [Bacteroidales bacterium]
MRKIAIPINGDNLHGHFGGAGMFKFYIVENNKVVNVEILPPPPHEPGVIPKWVAEMGATEIILGGI